LADKIETYQMLLVKPAVIRKVKEFVVRKEEINEAKNTGMKIFEIVRESRLRNRKMK
jgi:hypothetical protein